MFAVKIFKPSGFVDVVTVVQPGTFNTDFCVGLIMNKPDLVLYTSGTSLVTSTSWLTKVEASVTAPTPVPLQSNAIVKHCNDLLVPALKARSVQLKR